MPGKKIHWLYLMGRERRKMKTRGGGAHHIDKVHCDHLLSGKEYRVTILTSAIMSFLIRCRTMRANSKSVLRYHARNKSPWWSSFIRPREHRETDTLTPIMRIGLILGTKSILWPSFMRVRVVIIVGKRVHCDNTLSSVGPSRRI